jgi:cytochrome c oxidase subunit 4
MSETTHHVAPKRLYYLIFLALIVGTGLTVLAARFDLGVLNNVVMLTIACTKATLVVLYFMHVRWGTRLTWIVVVSGVFWLLIMFSFTMSDYMTRGWLVETLR